MTGPVLVTGAGGCVGRALVEVLLERGVDVRGVDRPGVRPPEPVVRAGRGRLEWVGADLARPEAIPPLVEGARGIINTAAIVDIAASFESQAPINWHAVRHLHEAARKAGVERLVHFSTGSLYAPREDGEAWREEDPLWPQNAYARTKLLSEDYLRSESARSGGPRITIVRPALIFGPYGRALVASLAAFAEMMRPLPVNLTGGPRTNLLHARDAARAAAFLLLDAEHASGEAFNIANKDVIDVGGMVTVAVAVARGAPSRLPALPYPTRLVRGLVPLIDREVAFRAVNGVASRLWAAHRWRHGRVAPELCARVDREALPFAAITAVFSVAKLEKLGFDWELPTFREAWEQTIAWYREHGWLPGLRRSA